LFLKEMNQMVERNAVQGRKRHHSKGTKCACPGHARTTARSGGRTNERLIKDRLHLPILTGNKGRARKMVNELQKSPLGRLITAIAMTPDLRPEKIEQGKKILRCRYDELEEKLVVAMERVLGELSYTG
jgi:hypothetical protein